MRIVGILTGAATALALAGCANGVIVNEPVFEQLYSDGDLEYAARYGELKTDVYGNPFPVDSERFSTAVTGHMKGANLGPTVEFATQPGGRGSGPYLVAMVFNAPKATAAASVCSAPSEIPTATGADAVTLLSGFCIGDTLLSTADGVVVGVKNIDDARFRALVRQVTLALFPAYDFHDIGGDTIIP